MGVKERYEQRQKEGQNAEYSGVKQRYMAKEIGGVASDITNRVNTWLNNHNNYITNYKNRYSGRKYGYEDAYVSDSADWLDTVSKQKSNFDAEADSIFSYIDQYKDYLNQDWIDDVKYAITSARGTQNQIVISSKRDNDWWNSFGSEELVSKYGSAEDAYKYYQRGDGYSKTYAGKTADELTKIAAELEDGEEKEWLTSYASSVDYNEKLKLDVSAAEAEIEELDAYVSEALDDLVDYLPGTPEHDAQVAKWFGKYGGDAKAMEAYVIGKKRYLAEAKKVQEHYRETEKWNRYTKAADFDLYASRGAAIENPSPSVSDTLRNHMTTDEVKLYNYLLAKQGKEAANSYLSYLEPRLIDAEGKRRADEVTGIDIPVVEDLAVLGTGALAGAENWWINTKSYFTGEEISPSILQSQNAYIGESLDGKFGQYAHQAATTIGNMAPSILVSAVLSYAGAPAALAQGLGAATMGFSAAGGAYSDALAKGYDKASARMYSTLVGASEGTLQYLIGGIGSLGGMSGKIASKVAAIDSGLLRTAAKLGLNITSEIAEEELQNFLEPAFRSIIFGEDYDAPTIEELVETAVVTALSTGVLEGGRTISETKAEQAAKKKQGNTDPVQQTVPGNLNIDELVDETIAQHTGAPADPVGAAVDGFRQSGTVTNKQATDILNSVKAVQQIVKETGVKLDGLTASQKRQAVRTAIEQMAQEQVSTESTSSAETIEPNGIKEQLRSQQDTLNNMQPAVEIQAPAEFSGMDKAGKQNWVVEKLRPTGYKVDRKGFGVIDFAKKRLKAAFKYFDSGSAEEASFEAIPYVLESGIEISSHEDHKGRNYRTVTIAAPVVINGKRGNMAVVVKQTDGNHYKVHRILTPDGSVFQLSETTNEADRADGGVTETGSLATSNGAASLETGVFGNSEAGHRQTQTLIPVSNKIIPNNSGTVNNKNGAVPSGLDTAQQTDYDDINNTRGGNIYGERLQQDDRTGSVGDSAERVAGVQSANRAESQGREQPGGLAVHAGFLRVSDTLISAWQKRGTIVYPVQDTTSTPDAYEQALIAGRESDARNGWCVTPKSAQELAEGNVRTFMNDSGTVGVGIAPDGDIVAVFKNQNGGPRRALDTMMPIAIEQGGDRLDCYGNGLVGIYAQYGFIPVARVEFNAEYANEGWTPDKGTPYIYFMMHNGDSAASVAERMGSYPEITKAQLDSLPTYGKDDYDAAMAYRNSLMNQRTQPPNTPDNGSTPLSAPSVGAANSGNSFGENTVGGAQSRFRHQQKESKIYTNTYANATDEAIRDVGKEARAADPNISRYDYISEKESLHNATQRTSSREDIDYEYDYLLEKNGWTGEDNDTAMRVLAYLRKTGDTARLRNLAAKQREVGTVGGQLTQSFAKYTRTPAYAADSAIVALDAMSDSDVPSKFYRGKSFETWKGEVAASIVETANQIETVEDGNTEGMKDIIRSLANFRHTTAMFGIRSNLTKAAENALKDIDFQTAKDIATAQLSQIPGDFRKRSVGQVVKTLRIHNMLSALTTVNRNLVGNASIGIMDATVDSTVGRALDALVALATKKRTVGNDVTHAKTYFDAAKKAANMAALCAELDVPMESESRFSTGRTRTYSPQGGPVMRFLSAYEKYMKYALEVTDKFFEGGSNAAVDESLNRLGAKSNLSEKEISELSEMVGQRRTFKEDRKLYRAAKSVKQGLNELGSDNIGLGDLTLPFAGTGSNVAQAAIDYSSGGLNGIFQIFKLMGDVKQGKYKNGVKKFYKNGEVVREITLAVAQRQAVTNAARGLTGTGLIAAFTALAAVGVLKVHDDEDKDKRALEQSLNLSGAQLNVDAALRWISGKSTEWQEDDWCLSVDFLEPFNAQMYVGYLLAQEESVTEMLKSYPGSAVRGIWQSILDMPLMQGLSDTADLISGVGESMAEGNAEGVEDAAGQMLGNTASGFIPSWLRQTAQYIDPYYRDTTGEDTLEKSINQVIAAIPGLSQTLPKKYSGLGDEQRRYDDPISGFFNTFVNPGDAEQVKSDPVVDFLGDLSERTGNVSIYPESAAPGSFAYGGKTVTISGKEMTESYQKTYGDNVDRLYGELIANSDFLSAGDDLQVKILESTKGYATKLARAAVSDYSEVPAYIRDRPSGMTEAEAILRHHLVDENTGTTKYTALPIEKASYVDELLDSLLDKPRETKPDGSNYANVRSIQQIEAIVAADKELTEAQQRQVLEDILDVKAFAKYEQVISLGYNNDEYAATYRLYLDTAGGEDETIRAIMRQHGLSRAAATALYEIYN